MGYSVSVQAHRIDYRDQLYAACLSPPASIRAIDSQAVRRDFALYTKVVGRFLPADIQAKILDLGCGFGGFVAYLCTRGYMHAQGVDINPQMVETAARLQIPGIRRADLRCYLAEISQQYSLITAFNVIEHFRKDEIIEVLSHVKTALIEGGRLIIWTPNAMSKYGRWCRYADFTHEYIFDSNSIRQCLTAVGFRRTRVFPLPPVVHGAPSAVRWALWQIWEPLLKVSFAVESGWEKEQVFTPNLVAVADK